MARTNGKLRQLTPRDAPWIGWGIIAVLLTALGFFGTLWIKKVELEISEVQRDTRAIQLAQQTEKARLDSLQVQVGTLTGVLDRISDNLRTIDSRLLKMEIREDQGRKNIR